MFRSFCLREIFGTYTFSSEKSNSSSKFVDIFLMNNLSNASEVSDRIIQFFKNTQPPIKTSFFEGTKGFQFWFSKLDEISILKSSASLFV